MCLQPSLPERDEVAAAEVVLEADLEKRSTMVLPSSQPPAASRSLGKMPSVTSVTQYGPLPWRRRLELGVPAGVAAVLNFCSHPQLLGSMPSPCPLSQDADGAASQKAPSPRGAHKVQHP